MTAAPADAVWPTLAIYAIVIIAAVLILVVFWILWKSRPFPGEHVFRASRFGHGNHLFPSQVIITPHSLTLYKPQWVGKLEESIHMAHVASIKIDTHLIFSDIYIETSGGQNPVVCHGHTKSDAIEIKQLMEQYQSDYYRTKT